MHDSQIYAQVVSENCIIKQELTFAATENLVKIATSKMERQICDNCWKMVENQKQETKLSGMLWEKPNVQQ